MLNMNELTLNKLCSKLKVLCFKMPNIFILPYVRANIKFRNMKDFFRKYLEQAKNENKLVAIRTNNEDTDKFSVGYILGINDQTINIKAINPNGLPDGTFSINTTDLYGIDLDDRYLKQLATKQKFAKEIFADTPSPSFFEDGEVNIKTILEKASEKKQLIHVNFYRDLGLYGYVNEINEEEFVFEVYNDNGEYDGISVYLIEDVKNINWDDIDTRSVSIFKTNNTGPNSK